ncbi:SDR family NAD(P)-dependent oxidoreductase [Brevibacillus brevis]|uniref:SDR family NAD(P)-dependent oxidoreductase n=1 Tax=Brevibacillus brevis TaxID=1393 RepID=UPI0025A4F2F2|nr:SDR family oxidoreductase [Brevibacillus brevis]WJQ79754.1 SDR family oxidoreductase [Brevibacillus brevis]
MLSNQKVIVTGAASGIGKAVVMHCLQEGAAVIACDLNQEALLALEDEMDRAKRLHTYCVDVSKYEEVAAFFAHIEAEHADCTSLVNNAGIYLAKNILDYDLETIEKVLAINVKGCIYFSQMFGKLLFPAQKRGAIVNLSSVSGIEGSSDAVYRTSKAAILGLTKSCAMNFAPYIRVNAVAPTMVATPMMDTIPEWRRAEYLAHGLIDSPVMPADVADSVVFLLSEKSKHYTGATFDINNGGYLR